MRRKALVGISLICLALWAMPISCGIEDGDSSIKMPDELPNGQKLVKTGGEEMLREDIGEIFPHCICIATRYLKTFLAIFLQ